MSQVKNEYEQLMFDTRDELEKAISDLTAEAIERAFTLIEKNSDVSDDNLMPKIVRNKFEAYGIAADQAASIDANVKMIKKDVQGLLDILPDPKKSAVEAAGSIFNSITIAARRLIKAAAIAKRTMNHLYTVESGRVTPLEAFAASEDDDEETEYQEAEPLGADESEDEEE